MYRTIYQNFKQWNFRKISMWKFQWNFHAEKISWNFTSLLGVNSNVP